MVKYKDVKDRQGFTKLYTEDYAGKLYTLDITPVNVKHLNTYLLDWIMMMEDSNNYDDFLLEEHQATFAGWTTELFHRCDQLVRRTMKELYRSRGVYIPINARGSVAQQLVDLLTLEQCTLWPEKDLEIAMGDPNFKCRQSLGMSSRNNAIVAVLPQCRVQQPLTSNAQAACQPLSDSHTLINLSELYTEEMKFNGGLYDVLNLKLKIFYDLCEKAGVASNRYHIALDTMLSGRAQTFYYEHLSRQGYTFEEMIGKMKAYFYTPENHKLSLNEWRTTMLKDVVAANPDKDLAQCLEIVVERLQRTHQSLSQNYGSIEGNLAGRIISACQGVPVCSQVLIRPSGTFEGVVSDLRSAIGIWMHCAQTTTPVYQAELLQPHVNDNVFYTDRLYNRNGDLISVDRPAPKPLQQSPCKGSRQRPLDCPIRQSTTPKEVLRVGQTGLLVNTPPRRRACPITQTVPYVCTNARR